MSKRLRCKDCENSDKYSYEHPCSTCYGYENFKEKKSMSNGDKIRSMSDEELAEFLAETELHGSQGSYKDYLEWLKSPTTD